MTVIITHPGTAALIHDYLELAGHGEDAGGALFRPLRNNTTGSLDRAITADGVYKLVRAYSARLGFEIVAGDANARKNGDASETVPERNAR